MRIQGLLHELNIALEVGDDVALLCEELVAAARLDFFDGLALEIAADPCCPLAPSSQPKKARAHARHYAQHPRAASQDRRVLCYSLAAWPSVAVDMTCGEAQLTATRRAAQTPPRKHTSTQPHTPPHSYLGRP